MPGLVSALVQFRNGLAWSATPARCVDLGGPIHAGSAGPRGLDVASALERVTLATRLEVGEYLLRHENPPTPESRRRYLAARGEFFDGRLAATKQCSALTPIKRRREQRGAIRCGQRRGTLERIVHSHTSDSALYDDNRDRLDVAPLLDVRVTKGCPHEEVRLQHAQAIGPCSVRRSERAIRRNGKLIRKLKAAGYRRGLLATRALAALAPQALSADERDRRIRRALTPKAPVDSLYVVAAGRPHLAQAPPYLPGTRERRSPRPPSCTRSPSRLPLSALGRPSTAPQPR